MLRENGRRAVNLICTVVSLFTLSGCEKTPAPNAGNVGKQGLIDLFDSSTDITVDFVRSGNRYDTSPGTPAYDALLRELRKAEYIASDNSGARKLVEVNKKGILPEIRFEQGGRVVCEVFCGGLVLRITDETGEDIYVRPALPAGEPILSDLRQRIEACWEAPDPADSESTDAKSP